MTKPSSALAAVAASALAMSVTVSGAHAQQAPAVDLKAADVRAAATVTQMSADEKVVLTHGIMPLPLGGPTPPIPADAIAGAGYIPGIARLGIPALKETDASLGVSYVMGIRRDFSTALPSGVAQA
ncbi:MAG: glycosyl hydrolase, partial [Novosphingobium sp.]|nr:glycosyl hydrolase [Novosphingobium sp.]